jgi:hypothetical protein
MPRKSALQHPSRNLRLRGRHRVGFTGNLFTRSDSVCQERDETGGARAFTIAKRCGSCGIIALRREERMPGRNRTRTNTLSVAAMLIGSAQVGSAEGASSVAEGARRGPAVEHPRRRRQTPQDSVRTCESCGRITSSGRDSTLWRRSTARPMPMPQRPDCSRIKTTSAERSRRASEFLEKTYTVRWPRG